MSWTYLAALLLSCQIVAASSEPDGMPLLRETAQKYIDAKSYHFEAVREETYANELSRSWNKTIMTAIADNERYHFEGRSQSGTAVLISDGKREWNYHVEEGRYTESAVSAQPMHGQIIPHEEMGVWNAQHLIGELRKLPSRLNSASLLSDEDIKVEHRSLQCLVVQFTSDAYKRAPQDGVEEVETLWIDKSSKLIVKIERQGTSFIINPDSSVRKPIHFEETLTFPIAVVGKREPDSAFVFAPPPTAKLVAEFPSHRNVSYEDQTEAQKFAPDVKFNSNGKDIALSELRKGKPIFIDFWASWCESCLDLIPDLKVLYAETAKRGLTWISVDEDEDSGDATRVLNTEHIPWANFHDEDGELGKAFRQNGIPLGVLIDSGGIIIFRGTGYDINALRNAVRKLGPAFQDVPAHGGQAAASD